MANEPLALQGAAGVDPAQEILRWRYQQQAQDSSSLGMLALVYYIAAGLIAFSAAGVLFWAMLFGPMFGTLMDLSQSQSSAPRVSTPHAPQHKHAAASHITPSAAAKPQTQSADDGAGNMLGSLSDQQHNIFLAQALIAFCIVLAAGAVVLAAAICIQRRKARRFILCVAVFLSLLFFPLSTILGVWTFLVFARPSVRELFGEPMAPPMSQQLS